VLGMRMPLGGLAPPRLVARVRACDSTSLNRKLTATLEAVGDVQDAAQAGDPRRQGEEA